LTDEDIVPCVKYQEPLLWELPSVNDEGDYQFMSGFASGLASVVG
jgi:hypothetical protein